MIGSLYALQYETRVRLAAGLYLLRNSRKVPSAAQPVPKPEKLLIVVSGMIGDSVMCAPAIREARRFWPGARITLLGQSHNCALFAGCPAVDFLHEATADAFTLRRRKEILGLKQWLLSSRFDAAIVLLGEQFGLILAHAGIAVRVGPEGHPLACCMTHTYDSGSPRSWGPQEKLNALRALGCKPADTLPSLDVKPAARISAAEKLNWLGVHGTTRYAALHPFGSTPCKRWPVGGAGTVASLLEQRHGLKTLLIGQSADAAPDLFSGAALVDARSLFTLEEILAVIERADLVISTDSGPFHIAGALGRPLVGLFRASRPEHASRYPQARVLFGRNAACDRECRWDRCRHVPCAQMENIAADSVLVEANLCLNGPQFLPRSERHGHGRS